MKKLLMAVAVTALLGACGQSEPVSVSDESIGAEFASDDERIIYSLGVLLGESIAEFNLSDGELELVAAGMRDIVGGAEPRVDMELYSSQLQMLATERAQAGTAVEKAASAAFADQIAAEAGAERLVSGVIYVPITEGDGENPSPANTVTVHYHGTLRDGTVFDSSVERDSPASFPLGGVIPCWTEGVQKIKVGGKAKLLCPSETAYGDQGQPGIPGGSALLFEVELLSFE